MNTKTDTITALSGLILALALAGCVTALTVLGKIDGQAAIAFLALLAGGGVAATSHASGVRAGARAAQPTMHLATLSEPITAEPVKGTVKGA